MHGIFTVFAADLYVHFSCMQRYFLSMLNELALTFAAILAVDFRPHGIFTTDNKKDNIISPLKRFR